MAARMSTWRRWMTATGLVAAAVVTPMIAADPAIAASLCGPPADTVPPQITGLTMSPNTVDVSNGPATVVVTATAVDTSAGATPSGVKQVYVFISGSRFGTDTRLALVSGTSAHGTWQGSVTIPSDVSGTLSLRQVEVTDGDRNRQDYSSYGKNVESPTDIRLQPGWDQSVTVTSAPPPPPPPTKPGVLTRFTFTPQSVNTTSHIRRVSVTASFSSPRPAFVSISFSPKGKGLRDFFPRVELKRTTGDHWAGQVTIKKWVGAGNAQPQLFAEYAENVKPRLKNISAASLKADHFPSVLKVKSGVDKAKPALETLAFTPSSVDTTTGAQEVDVTATASDNLSGVARLSVRLDHFVRDDDNGGYVNVNLTQQGSTWTGQIKFRRCVSAGSWKVYAFVSDHAGNGADYSPNKLAADSMPSQLMVTSTRGDVEPPSVGNSTASGAAHTITLDLSEGVKNVSDSTLDVFAMKPASQRYQRVATVSGLTCSNGISAVDCSGDAGLVTSVEIDVPSLSGGDRYQVWANLGNVTAQLTDGAGNPLSWDEPVADVTGS